MSGPRPLRPRLAAHVVVRRQVFGGDERIVALDAGGGGMVPLRGVEWDVLARADGTRDLDGVLRAAAREGVSFPRAHLVGLLDHLARAGMVADGAPGPPRPAPGPPPDRPLEPLPGFGLHCDGAGGCCRQYDGIVFSPQEVASARAAAPDVLRGDPRAFVPDRGSVSDARAVTVVDGGCAYLRADGRCAVHAALGAAAKPLRCRLFPATLVDDGVTVRVSAMVECACVTASAGRPGGEPLVPAAARTFGDLEPGTPARVLPAEVPLAPGRSAPREALAAWSAALADAPLARGDGVRAAWALARSVERVGLDPAPAREALGAPPPADPGALLPFARALAARARTGVEADAWWKAPGSRARRAVAWVAEAAAGLAAPGALATACAAAPADPATEAFYLRAALHGHHLAGGLPLATALRDRALRLLVARALPAVARRDAPADPAVPWPLCTVETALRAHGLAPYAGEAG